MRGGGGKTAARERKAAGAGCLAARRRGRFLPAIDRREEKFG